MKIRFGVCADVSSVPDIAKAGYDYFEYNLGSLAKMSDDAYLNFAKTVSGLPILPECFNCFFPPDISPVGEKTDLRVIGTYAEKGLKRAAEIGGKVAVIGSGGARRIPDGYDPKTAYKQFCDALDVCGNAAAKNGMTIVVEPLRAAETNLVNLVSEGMRVCRDVNNPHVRLLADFYHMYMGNESTSVLKDAADLLTHVHLARPNEDRCMPTEADYPTCKVRAEDLKKAGYSGRISLEGNMGPDFIKTITETKKMLDAYFA